MKLNIELLRQIIKDQGLTVAQAAEKIGITRVNLQLIFQNESTKLDTIGKIGRALDIDPRDLFII